MTDKKVVDHTADFLDNAIRRDLEKLTEAVRIEAESVSNSPEFAAMSEADRAFVVAYLEENAENARHIEATIKRRRALIAKLLEVHRKT